MIYQIILHSEIKSDLTNAALWYENHQIGLGVEFIDEFNETLICIQKYPGAFPLKAKKLRNISMKRFPFIVVFEIIENVVFVSLLIHAKQKPSKRIRK
ncbi:hypothetical protein BH09BAC5_BH09BAC5_22140 [soil metagenome]